MSDFSLSTLLYWIDIDKNVRGYSNSGIEFLCLPVITVYITSSQWVGFKSHGLLLSVMKCL